LANGYNVCWELWQGGYTGHGAAAALQKNCPTLTTDQDAEAWASDRRRQLDRGHTDPPEKITFAAYADRWLANRHVNGRPIKARTRAHYDAILTDHLLPEFGSKRLSAITPADVRGWHATTLTDRPTMRSHAYSLLSSIMGSAVRDELIAANPCRIVGAGRTNRVVKIKPATVEEISTLTAAMPDRLALMVLLASWCGLRWGETSELRRGDLSRDCAVLRVRRAVTYRGGQFHTGPPKTAAGVRDVAIPPTSVPPLRHTYATTSNPAPDPCCSPTLTAPICAPTATARTGRKPAPRSACPACGYTTFAMWVRCWPPNPAPPQPNSCTGSATRRRRWRCAISTSPRVVTPRSPSGCRNSRAPVTDPGVKSSLLVEYRCRAKGCLLLLVWQTPDGPEFVAPGHRLSDRYTWIRHLELFRHEMNHAPRIEPANIDDLPD
jgi:integrase